MFDAETDVTVMKVDVRDAKAEAKKSGEMYLGAFETAQERNDWIQKQNERIRELIAEKSQAQDDLRKIRPDIDALTQMTSSRDLHASLHIDTSRLVLQLAEALGGNYLPELKKDGNQHLVTLAQQVKENSDLV